MTPERAAEIAQRFIAGQDLQGRRYTFVSARPSLRHPGRWNATFRVETAQGAPVEGAVVVVIDEADEQPRFLGSL